MNLKPTGPQDLRVSGGRITALAVIILVALVILLVLVALLLSGAAARRAVTGGAPNAHDPPNAHRAHAHPLGAALNRYARELGPAHAVGQHPLDRDRYEAPPTRGGARDRGRPATRAPAAGKGARKWTEYETWEALAKDEAATAEYLEQRAAVLNNPSLDWGPVLREIAPRLAEDREYIGLVNLEPDGRTLRLEAHEASPVAAGKSGSETAFAAIPSALVAKYARRPALFLFHTHPADPRASPLPSSHDLSTCIYFASVARFAASVVISRFGVLAYGLDWEGYKAVNEAKDWTLAMLNLSHDVVAAHEAARSWASYTLQDYLAFYPRHRLFVFAYPTPEMVGCGRLRYQWDLESPIDHEVITEHSRDVQTHLGREAEKTEGAAKKTKSSAARFDAQTLQTARTVADLMGVPFDVDVGLD